MEASKLHDQAGVMAAPSDTLCSKVTVGVSGAENHSKSGKNNHRHTHGLAGWRQGARQSNTGCGRCNGIDVFGKASADKC